MLIVNLTCFCLWFLHKTRLIGYILPKKTIDSRYYTDIVPLTTNKVYSSSYLDIFAVQLDSNKQIDPLKIGVI